MVGKKEEKKEPVKPVLVVPDLNMIIRWILKNKEPIERLLAEIIENVEKIREANKRRQN